MSIPFIKGAVAFQTQKELEEVGKVISNALFGGLEFTGKEMRLCDEVPAIFIESDIIGLKAILNGYSGYGEGENFLLDIYPMNFTKTVGKVEIEEYDISEYLELILRKCFKDDDTIIFLK